MTKITLNELYEIMYQAQNPNGWWPGRSDWEIIWSTVLIQNTNWKNVAKAMVDLDHATGFLPTKILSLTNKELEQAIKSAGFYTRKAQTLKSLATYFASYNFDLEQMTMMPKDQLRKEILSLKGIGPETADVILMYALNKGEFVVDVYARRLFTCLVYSLDKLSYDQAKTLIERKLSDFTLRNYQNFHALIDMFNQEYKLPQDFGKSYLNGYILEI